MPDDIDAVPASRFPTQRETARMLGISESTLSRSATPSIRAGERGRHYRPTDVLLEATKHRRRSLNEVAADLIRYAEARDPESVADIRAEVEAFFANRPRPALDPELFLDEARRTLPTRLYDQVKRAYDGNIEGDPVQVVGESSQVSETLRG